MSLLIEGSSNETEGQRLVNELKDLLYNQDYMTRFFPEELSERIRKNFALFDRDGDNYINLDEVRELLNSVDVALAENDIQILYKELSKDGKGIGEEDFFIFLTKKLKEDNKEAQLLDCFRLIDKEGSNLIKDIDNFKDLLMTKGLRWTEEDVDEFIAGLNPKSAESFSYSEFCALVTKKDEGKGKKKKKKKKGK